VSLVGQQGGFHGEAVVLDAVLNDGDWAETGTSAFGIVGLEADLASSLKRTRFTPILDLSSIEIVRPFSGVRGAKRTCPALLARS
jgi:hypothetical protein